MHLSESTSHIFIQLLRQEPVNFIGFLQKADFGDYYTMEDQGQNVYLLSKTQLNIFICIVPSKLSLGAGSPFALHAVQHHTERQSLHQIACSQSQGNGRIEVEKDLLKITLQISREKIKQEDGVLWSPDPII